MTLFTFSKHRDFHFKVNTFTNFNSCMHLSVYRNILLNHLFRIKHISSTKFENKNIEKLIYDVLIRGYPKRFIYILLFLTNSWFIDIIYFLKKGKKQVDRVVVYATLRRVCGVV